MKICSDCEQTLPDSAFYTAGYVRVSDGKPTLKKRCKSCHINDMRNWEFGEGAAAWYAERLAENPQCEVCGLPHGEEAYTRLHLDHNHETGVWRGLLCGNCNTALGLLKEDPERIRALIDYINRKEGT